MRTRHILACLIVALLFAAGCGGGSGSTDPAAETAGGMSFRMDFNVLAAAAVAEPASVAAPAAAPNITAVSVTVTRAGYAPLVRELAVASNVATGQIDNLAAGYWHVVAKVYDQADLIYTGSADANVIAGTTVQCNILFDPTTVGGPTTGSIGFSVGLNPMPGFTVINQAVSNVLFDREGGYLYILDAPARIIGVYAADNLVRIRDLALPDSPLSIALDANRTGIFLGFPSGRIHRMDIATGQLTPVADVLMQVTRTVAISDRFLMAEESGANGDTTLKVVALDNGQVVGSQTVWYSLGDLVYNPSAQTVYAQATEYPDFFLGVKIDNATGAMSFDGRSPYYGSYVFGAPVRVISHGTRIATASGNMFSSALLAADDLLYSGNLGHAYTDLSADDVRGKLYILNSVGIRKLLVVDETTYFLDRTVDLPGVPARVFDTADSVIVFSTLDARFYAKSFAKYDLGL